MVTEALPAAQPPAAAPAPKRGGYGSRPWLERLYDGCGGQDPWAHDLRATQKLRYQVSLRCLPKETLTSGRILDLGCALGHFTEKLAAGGARVFASDVVWQALVGARSRLGDAPAVVAGLPHLPFDSQTFDLVCALEVLFYLPAPARGTALEEIRRVLKPGGKLLVSSVLGLPQYFGPGELVALVSRHFTVRTTATLRLNAYVRLEERLAYTLRQLRRLGNALNGGACTAEGASARARRARRVIERLQRLPALCALLGRALWVTRWLLTLALRWELPLRVASQLAPPRKDGRGASHVIVLGE